MGSINWDGEVFEMHACKNAFDGSHACDYGLCGPCRDAKFLRPRGETKTSWKRQTDLLDKAAMDRVKKHLGVTYGNSCDHRHGKLRVCRDPGELQRCRKDDGGTLVEICDNCGLKL